MAMHNHYYSMSNKVIVKCSQCGHDFITTKKQSGLKGAIAGAIAGSIVTIEVGPLAIGGALAGATIGYWAGKKTYCKCPKCGETLLRPEE